MLYSCIPFERGVRYENAVTCSLLEGIGYSEYKTCSIANFEVLNIFAYGGYSSGGIESEDNGIVCGTSISIRSDQALEPTLHSIAPIRYIGIERDEGRMSGFH
jgi:hypothetical protein